MKVVQGTLDEFLEWLEQENRHVICFGASTMADEALRERRLADRIQYLADSDPSRQGEAVYITGRRFPVCAPERLRQEDFSNTVLLITSGWFQSIMEELSSWPELAGVTCAAYPQLLNACAPDSEEFFRRRILDECLWEYGSLLEQWGETTNQAELLMEKRSFIQGNGPQDRPLVIPRG